MTFVLGMRSRNGVSLLADTLESGAAANRYRAKLHAINVGSTWGIAWGVAGSALVADQFTARMKKSLTANFVYSQEKVEEKVERCLRDVAKKSRGTDDDIDIVVGLFGSERYKNSLRPPDFYLYRADSITPFMAPVPTFCIAGMDVTLANFVLANSHHPFMAVAEAERLGVLTVALMKKYAKGVGGPTTGFSYAIGTRGWSPMLDRNVEDTEKMFDVKQVDTHMATFWAEHPNARSREEINFSEIMLRNARHGGSPSKRLASQKSKREK